MFTFLNLYFIYVYLYIHTRGAPDFVNPACNSAKELKHIAVRSVDEVTGLVDGSRPKQGTPKGS